MHHDDLLTRLTLIEAGLKQLRLEHDGLAACKVSEIKEIKEHQKKMMDLFNDKLQEHKEDINEKLNLIIIQTARKEGYFSGMLKMSAIVSIAIGILWQVVVNFEKVAKLFK